MSIPTAEIKKDPIWYRDIKILVNPERFIEFFPSSNSTLEENMNSLVRLGIYGSILISMYKRDPVYLSWIIVVLLLTYIIHKNYTPTEEHSTPPEGFEQPLPTKLGTEEPLKSTVSNPFMNPSFLNVRENRGAVEEYHQDTPEAEETRELISRNFNQNLFKDIDDVFGTNNAQRQFYTVPSTTIPSDQEKYKRFLFGDMNSCTDNSDACTPYQDLRRNPPIIQNPGQIE
jgi:hypothetical protein